MGYGRDDNAIRIIRIVTYFHSLKIIKESGMLCPLKFVAANIFMAGVTAGAVGGAAAVYVLSDQQRRGKLKDCADKMQSNCKTMWNTELTVPDAD